MTTETKAKSAASIAIERARARMAGRSVVTEKEDAPEVTNEDKKSKEPSEPKAKLEGKSKAKVKKKSSEVRIVEDDLDISSLPTNEFGVPIKPSSKMRPIVAKKAPDPGVLSPEEVEKKFPRDKYIRVKYNSGDPSAIHVKYVDYRNRTRDGYMVEMLGTIEQKIETLMLYYMRVRRSGRACAVAAAKKLFDENLVKKVMIKILKDAEENRTRTSLKSKSEKINKAVGGI